MERGASRQVASMRFLRILIFGPLAFVEMFPANGGEGGIPMVICWDPATRSASLKVFRSSVQHIFPAMLADDDFLAWMECLTEPLLWFGKSHKQN